MNRWILLLALLFATTASAQTQWREELIFRTANGQAADVALLLKHAPEPNLTDSLGQPLLFIAASRPDGDSMPIVKELIKAGAHVNYGGKGRHFPLIAAVQAANEELVAYFLEQGADFRVVDEYGVSVRDYARQGGHKGIAAVIEGAVEEERARQAALRSPEGYARLRYDLAYHSCALQYWGFYYASGQDPIAEDVQKTTLKRHKDEISRTMGQLVHYFDAAKARLSAIHNSGKGMLHYELEKLVSNRYRRKNGVGQLSDMEKRCKPIAKVAMDATESFRP